MHLMLGVPKIWWLSVIVIFRADSHDFKYAEHENDTNFEIWIRFNSPLGDWNLWQICARRCLVWNAPATRNVHSSDEDGHLRPIFGPTWAITALIYTFELILIIY